MNCRECGAWVNDGSIYCEHCGAPLVNAFTQNNQQNWDEAWTTTPEQVPQNNYPGGQYGYPLQNERPRTYSQETGQGVPARKPSVVALAAILGGAVAVIVLALGILILRPRTARPETAATDAGQTVTAQEDAAVYPTPVDVPEESIVIPTPDSAAEESLPQSGTDPSASEEVDNTPADEEVGEKKPEPFYGIWVAATEEIEYALDLADQFRGYGLDAQVFLTTDWSNLNPLRYYVITIGTYASREEAEAMLPTVKTYVSNAYVKYTGDWQGD